MIPALTLEPLSWDDLPEAAVLWADPAVIRWTNIAAPCTEAGAADRLEHLLDCQRGLPFSTVFALREGTAFRGLAGCPPVDTAAGIYGLFYQLLPACWGRGLGLAAAAEALRRLERLAPALVLADTVAENTASVRILERLGFVRTAVHHRAFCREGRMLDIWDYARRWAGPAEGSLSVYGESIPIACVGIITKVNQVFMAFVIGISQGLQPIVSFNYGAGLYRRVKAAYMRALSYGGTLAVVAFLLFQLLPHQIIALFGKGSPEYFQFAQNYFHIFLFFTFLNFL